MKSVISNKDNKRGIKINLENVLARFLVSRDPASYRSSPPSNPGQPSQLLTLEFTHAPWDIAWGVKRS